MEYASHRTVKHTRLIRFNDDLSNSSSLVVLTLIGKEEENQKILFTVSLFESN